MRNLIGLWFKFLSLCLMTSGTILCFIDTKTVPQHPFIWIPIAISLIWALNDHLTEKTKQVSIRQDLTDIIIKHAKSLEVNKPSLEAKACFLISVMDWAIEHNRLDLLIEINKQFYNLQIHPKSPPPPPKDNSSTPSNTDDNQEIEI